MTAILDELEALRAIAHTAAELLVTMAQTQRHVKLTVQLRDDLVAWQQGVRRNKESDHD